MYEKPIESSPMPGHLRDQTGKTPPEIREPIPVSKSTRVEPVSHVVPTTDGIALWRLMSETYRDRRLANEKLERENELKRQQQPRSKQYKQREYQANYEEDKLNLSAKSEASQKDTYSQLIHNIRLAQLEIPDDKVHTPKPTQYEDYNDGVLRVHQCMTKKVFSVIDSTPIKHVAALFHKQHISGIPVIHYLSHQLVGMITISDIIAQSYNSDTVSTFQTQGGFFEQKSLAILDQPVKELMQHHVINVDPYFPVKDACTLMVENNIHRLVITDNGKVKGMFTTFDATRLLSQL